jgi:hypothetical protein
MSHFAKIENGIVTEVIVAEQDFINTLTGQWVQTSYNTRGGKHYGLDGLEDTGVPLRKNYAGIGMIYDAVKDVFTFPQPYPSWVYDDATAYWNPPVPMPPVLEPASPSDPITRYVWDEPHTIWVPLIQTPATPPVV